MAWKVAQRDGSSLGAFRNGVDMPSETSYSVYTARDNALYHENLKSFSSGKPPVKFGEQIHKRPNIRQNSPSVVARLMGVDMLPLDTKLSPHKVGNKTESLTAKVKDKYRNEKNLVGSFPLAFSGTQQRANSLWYYTDKHTDNCSSHLKCKMKKREHPQEEELQKFKQEFEAWQGARFSDCSKVLKWSNPPTLLFENEEADRERRFLYANCKRTSDIEIFNDHSYLDEQYDQQGEFALGIYKENKQFSPHLLSLNPKVDSVSALSRIVLLRPGSDRIDIDEDSLNNSPVDSIETGDIKDFLEKVREKLKSEYQGKHFTRCTTIRGGGIETPYREKPHYESTKTPLPMTQEVRNSPSKDFCMNLFQAESTRSCEGKMRDKKSVSPELSSRGLMEGKKSILDQETEKDIPMIGDHCVYTSKVKKLETGHQSDDRNLLYSSADKLDRQSWSFRRNPDESETENQDLSPSNLSRSFSAPLSTRSFGKLVMEQGSLVIEEDIRWKPEVSEKAYVNTKKQKRHKISIKQKVSNIGYNLTLRGKLFGKRVKSVKESIMKENNAMRDDSCCTTATLTYLESNENYTEVPPSPASVCSSIQDEFWRKNDRISPTMVSNGNHLEDIDLSYVLKEINSNLSELRRKLNKMEGRVTEEAANDQQHTEIEPYAHDEAEAFVRELLKAAGFYTDVSSLYLLKWDSLGKPISSCIFEEVEETYKQKLKDSGRSYSDEIDRRNHKLILDLVNEVLSMILKEPMSRASKYMNYDVRTMPAHQGMALMSQVWSIIQGFFSTTTDRSEHAVDNMVAQDFCSHPWLRCVDEDISGIVRDTENHIMRNMIAEMIEDMLLLA